MNEIPTHKFDVERPIKYEEPSLQITHIEDEANPCNILAGMSGFTCGGLTYMLCVTFVIVLHLMCHCILIDGDVYLFSLYISCSFVSIVLYGT